MPPFDWQTNTTTRIQTEPLLCHNAPIGFLPNMRVSATVVAFALTVATLAYGAQGFPVNLMDLPGRVVVASPYPSPFPQEFSFVFVDAQGRLVADITVSENTKTTNFKSTRGGFSGEVRLLPDGTFYLKVPRVQQRLFLRLRPNPKASAAAATYFVKSVLVGSIDPREQPIAEMRQKNL
jgi:hypothetical protein